MTGAPTDAPVGGSQPLITFARSVDWVSRRIGTFAAWLCVPMILFAVASSVTSMVDKRFGTHLSVNALIDAQWYLFSAVFLLGAPVALAQGAHVRVDALYSRYSTRTKHWVDLVGTVVFLLPFCVFGVVWSLDFVARSWELLESSPDASGLPRYPIKTLVPIAFALLGVQGLAQIAKHVAVLRGADPRAVGFADQRRTGEEHLG